MLTFDDFIPYLGEFGPFQRKVVILACIIVIPNGAHIFAQVFLGAQTDHWCSIPPQWKYDNCTEWGFNSSTECEAAKKDVIIPPGSQCSRYDLDYDSVEFEPDLNATEFTNKTSGCEDGWTYVKSQYKSTIIHDFDLVCERKYLPDLAQSIFAAGLVAGTFVFGWMSDRVGRRPTVFTSIATIAVCGSLLAFSPNLYVYIALRIVIGAANTGLYVVTFVCATEYVGPSKRTFVGVVMANMWAVGYMALAVLAYFFRDWRNLELAISIPLILYVAIIPFFPESPRWLLASGKIERAKSLLNKAAACGKTTIPASIFDEQTMQTTTSEKSEATSDDAKEKSMSFIDIMRYPNMRYRTLNMMLCWYVTSMVYYGISLNTSNLGGNDYVAAFVSGAIEIPAYTSSLYIIEKWGRRVPLCVYLVLGGVICIATIWIPLGTWNVTVAMIGKFHVTAAFGVIYIYAAEIFATPVRSIGVGACCMASELSGIFTPMILSTGLLVWQPLPLLIFGTSSIISGVLVLWLPETKGEPLQETMEESEAFGKKGSQPINRMNISEKTGYNELPLKEETKEESAVV